MWGFPTFGISVFGIPDFGIPKNLLRLKIVNNVARLSFTLRNNNIFSKVIFGGYFRQ